MHWLLTVSDTHHTTVMVATVKNIEVYVKTTGLVWDENAVPKF